MQYACPMCGRSFSVENDFGAYGPAVCPFCGTQVGAAPIRWPCDPNAAVRKVRAPAIALIVVGGLTFVMGFFYLGITSLASTMEDERPEDRALMVVFYGLAG